MDLNRIKNGYPIHDTLIGCYSIDQSFFATTYDEVKDIDQWENAPLDHSEGFIPFIRYNQGEFECIFFGYYRVSGYYTVNGEDYQLVTFSEDFGYEVFDPNNEELYDENNIIIPPDRNENIVKKIARVFDPAAYKEGRIFFTYDEVKDFVYNMEESK